MILLLTLLWTNFLSIPVCASITIETVGFVTEDNQRDTISLLLSCLVTLGICIYSAVHLNIPSRRERYSWILLRELKWCIVGLFAPELVLYTAWRQRASAKQLCDEIKDGQLPEANENKPQQRQQPEETLSISDPSSALGRPEQSWNLRHGFYATMGGIAIDIDPENSSHANIFGNATRLTLTAKGVSLLAKCGHLPYISAEDIRDKNKTDSLAKLVVCVQAGWMIVQVTARRAYGLPITLLEVHTVAHVACALLMYVIWWHKPRQVEAPTLLHGEWVLPLAAYMYSASRMSGQKLEGMLGKLSNPTAELKHLVYMEELGDTVVEQAAPIYQMNTVSPATSSRRGFLQPVSRNESTPNSPTPHIPLPEDEWSMERRKLVERAILMYPAIRGKFKADENSPSGHLPSRNLKPYATELVQPYALNWPNAGLLRRTQSLILGMVLWGASMVYGAIHVAAWDYFFPTYEEHLLWCLSSVWVTFCAAFWLFTNLLAHFLPLIDRIWVSFNERQLGWFGSTVIIILCTLCGISFVASRAFLVVEAFVSIRKVPVDVYTTPQWSQMFPHL